MSFTPNKTGRYLRLLLAAVLLLGLAAPAQDVRLPLREGSVRFAVIGDSGTGGKRQYQIAGLLESYRKQVGFDFVLMLGDNIYGGDDAKSLRKKFEEPYRPLLDAGVKFYASLGNHDHPTQADYKLFNMDGRRYYRFRRGRVNFYALDSTYMDTKQQEWLKKELAGGEGEWKIAFFHHPLYSSGMRHGSSMALREILEPILMENGVRVALSGHDHLYERLNPQNGVYYFVSGAAAKLRKSGIRVMRWTAKYYAQDNSFMLVEIAGDELYFQTIARNGEIVDAGMITRTPEAEALKAADDN
jgi:predicted MPP superfamily phosphohydrolase